MATSSSIKTPCSTCDCKSVGILKCEGCSQIFCRKHVNEHRDILSHQLDEIVLEHDTLQHTIVEQKDKQKSLQPLLKQIDEWERDSIMKIQQTAEEARQQIEKLTTSQRETASKELYDLAEQLRKARVDDDYVETDLRTWTTMLDKLKRDFTTAPPSIAIYQDPKETLIAKMCVSSTKQPIKEDERFGESFGNILIDENGREARVTGSKSQYSFVRGTGEYSSGKHKIRFRASKQNAKYVSLFGIISKSTSIPRSQSVMDQSAYGWYSSDTTVPPNSGLSVTEGFRDMKGHLTLDIELLVDCDNRKISYFNEQTQNTREINVDIKKCPFPWQLLFYLYDVGERIQLESSYKVL